MAARTVLQKHDRDPRSCLPSFASTPTTVQLFPSRSIAAIHRCHPWCIDSTDSTSLGRPHVCPAGLQVALALGITFSLRAAQWRWPTPTRTPDTSLPMTLAFHDEFQKNWVLTDVRVLPTPSEVPEFLQFLMKHLFAK
ncbi:unnamed protein product [Heligmosomoides polygyrus]|uniref:Uncharacterized protein n=1 Tax=Heligmosomoides polygyrus TaxID=6339 RepID=A0A183FMF3_HELPZ|nr:unnamed protein product [Heligmosomoides polygyrus]